VAPLVIEAKGASALRSGHFLSTADQLRRVEKAHPSTSTLDPLRSQTKKQGAQALVKLRIASTAPAGPLSGLVAAPSKEEAATLTQSLSAIEVKGSAAMSVQQKLKVAGLGAQGSLEAQMNAGCRVEFKDGKPTAIVSVRELEGEAGASIGGGPVQKLVPADMAERMKSETGVDPRKPLAGTAQGTLRIEDRFPINAAPVAGGSPQQQIDALLRDPSKAVGGPATVSVIASGSVSHEGRGFEGEAKLEGVQYGKLGDVLAQLKKGDWQGAYAASGATSSTKLNRFEDERRGWLDGQVKTTPVTIDGTNSIHRVLAD